MSERTEIDFRWPVYVMIGALTGTLWCANLHLSRIADALDRAYPKPAQEQGK